MSEPAPKQNPNPGISSHIIDLTRRVVSEGVTPNVYRDGMPLPSSDLPSLTKHVGLEGEPPNVYSAALRQTSTVSPSPRLTRAAKRMESLANKYVDTGNVATLGRWIKAGKDALRKLLAELRIASAADRNTILPEPEYVIALNNLLFENQEAADQFLEAFLEVERLQLEKHGLSESIVNKLCDDSRAELHDIRQMSPDTFPDQTDTNELVTYVENMIVMLDALDSQVEEHANLVRIHEYLRVLNSAGYVLGGGLVVLVNVSWEASGGDKGMAALSKMVGTMIAQRGVNMASPPR